MWFLTKAASYVSKFAKWIPGLETVGRWTGLMPADYSEAREEQERLRVRAASVDQAKETMETISGLIFLSPFLPDAIEGTSSLVSGLYSSVTSGADVLLKGAFGAASVPAPGSAVVSDHGVSPAVEPESPDVPLAVQAAETRASVRRHDEGLNLSIGN